MKKILAVLDAVNYTGQQLDVIASITSLQENSLTIYLLEDTKSANQLLANSSMEGFAGKYYETLRRSEKEKKEQAENNYIALRNACKEKKIACVIKNIRGIAEDEVLTASRFSDLLVIGKDLSFPFLYDTNPTEFVKNMLIHAQCPVVVIPEEAHQIDGVAFCYNGTYSSMYAIKTFAALFPELVNRHSEILYVCEKDQNTIPHKDYLQAYLKAYNAHLRYKVLTGQPDKAIKTYMETRTDLICTFGAYGRSRISRFFNSSSADNIIRNLKGPVFITHPSA